MAPSLFVRAVAAVIALPGGVAFFVPWLLAPARRPAADGVALVVLGTVGLLWCVREFYVAGRGTLAPWAPPVTVVSSGPYRWSRNPMYVAVLLILVGWALAFRSWPLTAYAACVAGGFHVRIVYYEEPWLARLGDHAWTTYRARVPRWLGRPSDAAAHDRHRP